MDLDPLVGPDTVIASNSSSYTISEIMSGLPLRHAERMASLHSCEHPKSFRARLI
jgi:3-hydroxyacyl-CoA dehydrogenase